MLESLFSKIADLNVKKLSSFCNVERDAALGQKIHKNIVIFLLSFLLMEGYSGSGVNKETTLLPTYLASKDMLKSSEASLENR